MLDAAHVGGGKASLRLRDSSFVVGRAERPTDHHISSFHVGPALASRVPTHSVVVWVVSDQVVEVGKALLVVTRRTASVWLDRLVCAEVTRSQLLILGFRWQTCVGEFD